MNYFEQRGQELIWRNRNETLSIMPWGADSLRVRAALVGDVADTRFALLEPEPSEDVSIEIHEETASIRNGASLPAFPWTAGTITPASPSQTGAARCCCGRPPRPTRWR